MKINTYIKLSDLCKFEIGRTAKERADSDGYCVYWTGSFKAPVPLDAVVYISYYPKVTDEDEEIFPVEVIKQDLALVWSDELIQDVIDNALHQKPNVSINQIHKAINYYDHYDCFMDLNR